MKVVGLIRKISRNSITLVACPEWDYDEFEGWRPNHPLLNTVEMTLRLDPKLLDKAISSYAHLLEFQIKEGKIINIKKLKLPQSKPSTFDIDLITIGKPKPLRDKLKTVLETIEQMEMESQQHLVEKNELLKRLEASHGIPIEQGERLISHLLYEGTIFEPKEGYIKKT